MFLLKLQATLLPNTGFCQSVISTQMVTKWAAVCDYRSQLVELAGQRADDRGGQMDLAAALRWYWPLRDTETLRDDKTSEREIQRVGTQTTRHKYNEVQEKSISSGLYQMFSGMNRNIFIMDTRKTGLGVWLMVIRVKNKYTNRVCSRRYLSNNSWV